jgi:hypothetical protein
VRDHRILLSALLGFFLFGCAAPRYVPTPVASSPPQNCNQALFAVDGVARGFDSASPRELVDYLKNLCTPGQPISLPSSQGFIIRNVCDFNRSMTDNGETTRCVMVGNPSSRMPGSSSATRSGQDRRLLLFQRNWLGAPSKMQKGARSPLSCHCRPKGAAGNAYRRSPSRPISVS